MIEPDIGFTSDVIRDPQRFVGRTNELRDCSKALNSSLSLIAVYGKRGVGKSSLLRQVQQLAVGNYGILKASGLAHEIPKRLRTYLTVYYTCDSMIQDGAGLLKRLCNDQDAKDGLLRLVPNDGKELVEFERSKEVKGGIDLQVVNWGAKGVETSKYARTVEGDIIQTFRNFCSAIIQHQVKARMKRDGLLIMLDEFDVIKNKSSLGSLIKSLTTEELRFAICGIGRDMQDLVEDHASVERLLEEGSIPVRAMSPGEIVAIFDKAERLFKGQIKFKPDVVSEIALMSSGYPYLAQLIGKECVHVCNQLPTNIVDLTVLHDVKKDISSGRAFPTLEAKYQRAIGDSRDRQVLLHFLADQDDHTDLLADEMGKVLMRKLRSDVAGLGIQYIDQLIPRLVDKNYGPVLFRHPEKQGVYEFENPIFRLYVKLRRF
jgi:Cdc6-like AAA superfamily ATPase